MKNDEYNGYAIPANSLMIANIWGMAQDTRNYPNPDEFCPERFENLDRVWSDRLDPKNYVFGFGRRQCPGKAFADASVFLVLAHIVATLEISRAVDEQGREIVLKHAYKSGFVHHLLPFKYTIRPRSEKRYITSTTRRKSVNLNAKSGHTIRCTFTL